MNAVTFLGTDKITVSKVFLTFNYKKTIRQYIVWLQIFLTQNICHFNPKQTVGRFKSSAACLSSNSTTAVWHCVCEHLSTATVAIRPVLFNNPIFQNKTLLSYKLQVWTSLEIVARKRG